MLVEVNIEEIKLSPTHATRDEIHYIDAVTKLVFIVSVPFCGIRLGAVERLQAMAEQNLHSFVKYQKPKNLFCLDSGKASYGDLAILSCIQRGSLFFLMLESLTFCKIGVVESIKSQISDDLSSSPIRLEVSHAN